VGMCSSLQGFRIWVSLQLKKIGRFTLNLFAFTSHQSNASLDYFFGATNITSIWNGN